MSSYLPNGFRAIPRAADHYALAPNDTVFNLKTKKKLKAHWNGHKYYTILKDKDGNQFRFCAQEDMGKPTHDKITKEWVLEVDKAKIIPDYPDYAITHYGSIYRINPRSSGPRAHGVQVVSSFLHAGHTYVNLSAKNKPQKLFRVDKLTEQIWGGESTFQD